MIVDAAAELPQGENFERFISTGANLVAFSGGKAIRGPQTTGILAGRRDLIESVALQNLDMYAADNVWIPSNSLIDIDEYDGVSKQGIGRSNKSRKEELIGLLKALEQFVAEIMISFVPNGVKSPMYFSCVVRSNRPRNNRNCRWKYFCYP